jgi:FkbM family methyltransferase
MKKVFIDCGGNKGQGLRAFIQKYNIDKDWIIEIYEPNPLCNLQENIKDLIPNYNIKIFNCAVFDYTGIVKFSQMLENDEGSSVNSLMSDYVCSDPTHPSYRKHNSIIEVNCKDISDIINSYSSTDYIVVKMDIEGSEFSVLRKTINDNSINKIKELYVEWHTQYLVHETDITCTKLKNEIIKRGVSLYEWH